MSFWQQTLEFFGFSSHESDDLQFSDTVNKLPEDTPTPSVVRTVEFKPKTEIHIEEPRTYEESLRLSALIRQNNPVIVKLKYLCSEESQQLVSFLCGATYVLNGQMIKLGEEIFLFTPQTVPLSDPEKNTTTFHSEQHLHDRLSAV